MNNSKFQKVVVWFAAVGGLVFLGAFGYTALNQHASAVESETPVPACVFASETTQLVCASPTRCLECRHVPGAIACYAVNVWEKCVRNTK